MSKAGNFAAMVLLDARLRFKAGRSGETAPRRKPFEGLLEYPIIRVLTMGRTGSAEFCFLDTMLTYVSGKRWQKR